MFLKKARPADAANAQFFATLRLLSVTAEPYSAKVRSASVDKLLNPIRQNTAWHVSKGFIVHVTTADPEANIIDLRSFGAQCSVFVRKDLQAPPLNSSMPVGPNICSRRNRQVTPSPAYLGLDGNKTFCCTYCKVVDLPYLAFSSAVFPLETNRLTRSSSSTTLHSKTPDYGIASHDSTPTLQKLSMATQGGLTMRALTFTVFLEYLNVHARSRSPYVALHFNLDHRVQAAKAKH